MIFIAASVAQFEAAQGTEFKLSLPLDCTPGKTCILQNYVDMVRGPGTGDYACGHATYDEHKGTDFRLLSIKDTVRNVAVFAAAPGRVRGLRDGMPDKLMTDRTNPAVKGRECGNGVVIDHAGGWQTQYCHLKQGSVRVGKGDTVKRGAHLGDVGYSGAAQFAHLHLAVRHKGRVIDPFLAQPVGAACTKSAAGGLWDAALAPSLKYKNGQLIADGFAGAPVNTSDVERGAITTLTKTSQALLYFARFINLHKGDVIRLALSGPKGIQVDNTIKPLERTKAQYVAYIGKKRRSAAWPDGDYQGSVDLIRQGKVVLSQSATFSLAQ